MKKLSALLLIALMFAFVGSAMADPSDPGLYLLTGTTSPTSAPGFFGTIQGGPTAVTSILGFPSESVAVPTPSASGFYGFYNDTGSTITTLFEFAPVAPGYLNTSPGGPYTCGLNGNYATGGTGSSTPNCVSFYDASLFSGAGGIVFEYYGLDILSSSTVSSTNTFWIGAGDDYWNDGPEYLTVPEPASLMMFGSSLLGLCGLLRRKLRK